MSSQLTEAAMPLIGGEVIGEVGVFRLEFCSAGGEYGHVFGVVTQLCVIAEEVFILERACACGWVGGQQAPHMVIVPSDVGPHGNSPKRCWRRTPGCGCLPR